MGDEFVSRPKAVEAAEKRLVDIRALMKKWETTMPQVTADERASVIVLVDKAEAWIKEKKDEQEKLARHEPPAFLSKNVDTQLKPVATLVTKLGRKPKPAPPKKNATNTTASNGTEAKNETIMADDKNETTEDKPEVETPEG